MDVDAATVSFHVILPSQYNHKPFGSCLLAANKILALEKKARMMTAFLFPYESGTCECRCLFHAKHLLMT